MLQQFSNNATSTLDSGVSIGVTSLALASGGGALFPSITAGQYFYVRLGTDLVNEVVKVTARSTDTLTCEATTSAWDAATFVMLTCSAEMLGDFAQANGGGQVLQNHELKDYAETVTSPTSSSGLLTLNLENGNVFAVTLTENITSLTLSNPPTTGKAGSVTLILTQDGTGGRTVTWPTAVLWPGGTEPTLSSGGGDIDVIVLVTVNGGTSWYGMLAGADFS